MNWDGERVDGRCSKCGGVWPDGGWPFCAKNGGPDGHGRSVQTDPFMAIFDYGLGEEVTSLGQRKQLMRQHHLDYRDHPSRGDQSARLDKIADKKRTLARQH